MPFGEADYGNGAARAVSYQWFDASERGSLIVRE